MQNVQSLPVLGNDECEIDSELIPGLHFFLSGMTNPDDTGAFLDFWRGLEILTLSEPGDVTRDIVERAVVPIRPEDQYLFDKHVDRIVDTRNDLVHGNVDTDVTQADLNLLKQLHETLLDLYIHNREEWSTSDVRFILHDCGVGDEDKLAQQKEARLRNIEKIEREIELIDNLREDDE
jgi:hypothetical protein